MIHSWQKMKTTVTLVCRTKGQAMHRTVAPNDGVIFYVYEVGCLGMCQNQVINWFPCDGPLKSIWLVQSLYIFTYVMQVANKKWQYKTLFIPFPDFLTPNYLDSTSSHVYISYINTQCWLLYDTHKARSLLILSRAVEWFYLRLSLLLDIW